MNAQRQPEPWERQPGESSEAFQAFRMYRDAEPKIGAAKVGERCGKSPTLTERWCTKYNWKNRREAWEDEQDRKTRETLQKGVTKMLKNHADIATAMLVKGLKALQKIPDNELSARDIATMIDIGSKLERLSRGEATAKTESRNEISGDVTLKRDPYEELSVEELRGLLEREQNDNTPAG